MRLKNLILAIVIIVALLQFFGCYFSVPSAGDCEAAKFEDIRGYRYMPFFNQI